MRTIYSLPEVVVRLSPESRDLRSTLVLSIQVRYSIFDILTLKQLVLEFL